MAHHVSSFRDKPLTVSQSLFAPKNWATFLRVARMAVERPWELRTSAKHLKSSYTAFVTSVDSSQFYKIVISNWSRSSVTYVSRVMGSTLVKLALLSCTKSLPTTCAPTLYRHRTSTNRGLRTCMGKSSGSFYAIKHSSSCHLLWPFTTCFISYRKKSEKSFCK